MFEKRITDSSVISLQQQCHGTDIRQHYLGVNFDVAIVRVDLSEEIYEEKWERGVNAGVMVNGRQEDFKVYYWIDDAYLLMKLPILKR